MKEKAHNTTTGDDHGHELRLALVDGPVSDAHVEDDRRTLLSERKHTVPQAARMLGVGENKLREIIRKGMIPVLDLGGKHLLLERDLEAFLQGHYGAIGKAKPRNPGLPPLPQEVLESELLKEAS